MVRDSFEASGRPSIVQVHVHTAHMSYELTTSGGKPSCSGIVPQFEQPHHLPNTPQMKKGSGTSLKVAPDSPPWFFEIA